MKSIYKSARTTIAIILVIATVAVFGYDLFDIQVNKNEYYAAQNNTVKTYTVPIEAARGEIVDRNGNPLVTNRQGNSMFTIFRLRLTKKATFHSLPRTMMINISRILPQ